MTSPFDDPTVEDSHALIRRINPAYHLKPDRKRGNGFHKPNSLAFKASSGPNDGMSVNWMECLNENCHDPKTFGSSNAYTCAMMLSVADVRVLGLSVGHTPTDVNDCHVDIWFCTGTGQAEQFPREITEALIDKAGWLVRPKGIKV